MVANINPVYVNVPNYQISAVITGANTATDGTGTVTTIFTAGTNGSVIKRLFYKSLGTNSLSVIRVFINNGSTNTVATNNDLIKEPVVAASTASNTAPIGPDYEVSMNFLFLPSGYTLIACMGTATTNGTIIGVEGGNL